MDDLRSQSSIQDRMQMRVDDEAQLVRAAQQGNQVALGVLLSHLETPLLATAYGVLRSRWDAEDVVQETLEEACKSIRSLRDASKIRPWAVRILLNRCYTTLRRRYRDPLTGHAEVDMQVEAQAALDGDWDLREAVQHLSDDKRVLVYLRFILGLTYADMSSVTGLPVGTVKSRIHRALRDLREDLGEDRPFLRTANAGKG